MKRVNLNQRNLKDHILSTLILVIVNNAHIVQRSNKIIDVANKNYDSYFKEFIKYIQDTDDEAGSKSANFIKNNTNLYEVNYTYNGNNSDTLEFCLEYKYNNTDKLPVSMIIHYTNYKLAHIEFNLI